MKKALKSSNGIATVMAVLAEEERKNTALQNALRASTPTSAPAQANVSTLQVQLPPASSQSSAPPPVPAPAPPANPSVSALEAAYPATSLTLKSILRNGIGRNDFFPLLVSLMRGVVWCFSLMNI